MTFIQIYREFSIFPDFSTDVHIDADTISFKTNIPNHANDKTTSCESTFSFKDLRARNDACGFDRWVFRIDENANHYPVRNLHADTYLTKQSPTEHVLQNRINYLFHTIMRPEDMSFLDCVYYFNIPDHGQLTCNLPTQEGPRVIAIGPKFYWPQLKFNEISRTASEILISVETAPSVTRQDIYLKSNAGFVPHKTTILNGQGKFAFTSLGMADGDIATIKAGFEYFSNVSSLTLTR